MEIKQLQCFVVCTETGSFTRAAEALYINQSNVSRMIRALEEELGITLFKRSKKGIFLTVEGEQVYRKAKTILFRIDHLKIPEYQKNMDHFTMSSFAGMRIPVVFSQLCHDFAGEDVAFRFMTDGTAKMLNDLEHHNTDVGFIYSSEKQMSKLNHVLKKRGLVFFPVFRALPALYYREGHPLERDRQFLHFKEKGGGILDPETARDLAAGCRFVRMDYDYEENYHDLRETIFRLDLDDKMKAAHQVNDSSSLFQLLQMADFCYLGHVWMDRKGERVICADFDDSFCCLPVKSEDGDIFMGYVIRQDEVRLAYLNEVLRPLIEEVGYEEAFINIKALY